MPRIAAALGVFATLTFCVGFNAVQYPAVWKMVAVPTTVPSANQTAQPATSAASTATARAVPIAVPQRSANSTAEAMSKPAPAVPAMASSMPAVTKPVCDPATGVCQIPALSQTAKPKPSASSVDRAAPIGEPDGQTSAKSVAGVKKDKPTKPPAKKANAAAAAKTSPSTTKPAPRPPAAEAKGLVPVVRSTAATDSESKPLSPSRGTSVPDTTHEPKMVRRLPPIDNSLPPTLSDDPLASDAHIPIYPSTTVR